MRSCGERAGVDAYGMQTNKRRGMLRSRLFLAGTLSVATALATGPVAAQPPSNPVEILFVGNSFTHGRYIPALSYNAGPGNSTNNNLVHDLLCPSLTAAGRPFQVGWQSFSSSLPSVVPNPVPESTKGENL